MATTGAVRGSDRTTAWSAKTPAQVFAYVLGAVLLLVTLIGLIDGVDVLGLLPVNAADNVLHIALTAAALLAGFSSRGDDA